MPGRMIYVSLLLLDTEYRHLFLKDSNIDCPIVSTYFFFVNWGLR